MSTDEIIEALEDKDRSLADLIRVRTHLRLLISDWGTKSETTYRIM